MLLKARNSKYVDCSR